MIGEFIQTHNDYQSIEMKGNNISPLGLEFLIEGFQKCQFLKVLVLEWNNLGENEKGAEILQIIIKNCPKLETVDLKNNKFQKNSGMAIGNLLNANTSLRYLDLRWNELMDEGVEFIIEALVKFKL